MAYKTDFDELRSRFTIEKVAELLGLETRKASPGLRAPCPVCGGNRSLAINTKEHVYYCWGVKEGGNMLHLIAHVRQCDVKEAAAWLTGTVPSKREDARNHIPTGNSTGFKSLDYLDPEHDAVVALGFERDDAKALGIGYAPRGSMKGHVLIPVRLEDGTLAGYVGITDCVLPEKWHGLPDPKIVPLKRA